MKGPNIIFITDIHLWSMKNGKGGRAFITTVEGYISDGWNVVLITTGGNVPEHIKNSITVVEPNSFDYKKFIDHKNKLVRQYGKYKYIKGCNEFYESHARKALEGMDTKQTVLYAYEVAGVFVAKKLSKEYNVPLVTRFQGTVHTNTPKNLINRLRFAPHFSALGTSADLVIMTNDGTQGLKALKKFGNKTNNVKFWTNGIKRIPDSDLQNRDDYRRELGFGNTFIFLTVSRLVGWKKVDRAIRAFCIVASELKDSKLFIVGDGASKKELETLSNSLNLKDRVVFVGAIEQKDVKKYMISSDVFLSLYDLSNVGNPLLEAMMCGKPIITINNGDTGMFINNEENGILLNNGYEVYISQAMKLLYSNSMLCNRIGSQARKFALENLWTWEERMGAEIQEVKSLIKQYN